MQKIHALVLGVLLVAAPAFAAAVDGKWTGSIDTPNGPVPVSFTFKADASALMGTTTGPDGGEVPLKGGKIEYDVDQAVAGKTQPCVHSLFSHAGYSPCWYVRRQNRSPIPMILLR